MESARVGRSIVFQYAVGDSASLILNLVESRGLQDANPVSTPMDPDFHKQREPGELLPNKHGCREAIGKMLYLGTMTRLDGAAAVGILCQRTSSVTQRD